MSPLQIRAILRDPATGTPPAATETTAIGIMPDLEQIIDNTLNVSPDVYSRDHVGDDGDPHTGPISTSPDIIICPDPVVDPNVAYGAGSGTENMNTLGSSVEFGQDNYIYTRVLNRGGSDAADVTITLFWSPASTLITPDLWTEIGSTTIPLVDNSDDLTVSEAIVWEAADIPDEGHYCIVGLVGNAQDPPPNPADFLEWANFTRFIKESNNVTWRNFNVVDNEPDVPAAPAPDLKFKALEFFSPGAPRQAIPMQLELTGKLPKGAQVYLELPQYYGDMLNEKDANVELFRAKKTSFVRLKQFGRHRLSEVLYQAKIRNKMRLLVHIPKKYRSRTYDIAVCQLFKG